MQSPEARLAAERPGGWNKESEQKGAWRIPALARGGITNVRTEEGWKIVPEALRRRFKVEGIWNRA